MNTYQASEREQRKAEGIRRQYVSREENKMEQLQKLDSKVKLPGKIVGSILGVIWALVMGACMSLVMVWGNMTMGLALSIPGLAVLLLVIAGAGLYAAVGRPAETVEITGFVGGEKIGLLEDEQVTERM